MQVKEEKYDLAPAVIREVRVIHMAPVYSLGLNKERLGYRVMELGKALFCVIIESYDYSQHSYGLKSFCHVFDSYSLDDVSCKAVLDNGLIIDLYSFAKEGDHEYRNDQGIRQEYIFQYRTPYYENFLKQKNKLLHPLKKNDGKLKKGDLLSQKEVSEMKEIMSKQRNINLRLEKYLLTLADKVSRHEKDLQKNSLLIKQQKLHIDQQSLKLQELKEKLEKAST